MFGKSSTPHYYMSWELALPGTSQITEIISRWKTSLAE